MNVGCSTMLRSRAWRRGLGVGLVFVILALAVGCRQGAAGATATPLSEPSPLIVASPQATATNSASSVTNSPTMTPAPTAPPMQPVPSPSPTEAPQLETESIRYSGALSVEDLNTLMLDLLALPGVHDVQGGPEQLEVTYDPKRISHQEIVSAIKSHGYEVEE